MRQLRRTERHLANLTGLVGQGHPNTHPAIQQLRTALGKDAILCPTVADHCTMAASSSNVDFLQRASQAVLLEANMA